MTNKILPLFILLTFVGCASTGSVEYEKERYNKDGTLKSYRSVTVSSPDSPVKPALFEGNPKEKWSANTGNQQEQDFIMQGVTSRATWAGIALIVIGVGLVVASFYFPALSWNKGAIVAGAGAALLWFPVLIDRYTWLLVIGGAVAAIIIFADDIYRAYKGLRSY
jgi:hypothetical protein